MRSRRRSHLSCRSGLGVKSMSRATERREIARIDAENAARIQALVAAGHHPGSICEDCGRLRVEHQMARRPSGESIWARIREAAREYDY